MSKGSFERVNVLGGDVDGLREGLFMLKSVRIALCKRCILLRQNLYSDVYLHLRSNQYGYTQGIGKGDRRKKERG